MGLSVHRRRLEAFHASRGSSDESPSAWKRSSDLGPYLNGPRVRKRSYQQLGYVKRMLLPVRCQLVDAGISMVRQSASGGISGFRPAYMGHGLEKSNNFCEIESTNRAAADRHGRRDGPAAIL